MFGVSTQTTEYQREMAERLHLPFSHMMDMGPTYGPGNQDVNPNVGAGEVAIKIGTNVLYLPGIDHDHIVKDKKYRTSWYRLGGVSGFTAGALRCPLQFVDAHLALLHVRIPSVTMVESLQSDPPVLNELLGFLERENHKVFVEGIRQQLEPQEIFLMDRTRIGETSSGYVVNNFESSGAKQRRPHKRIGVRPHQNWRRRKNWLVADK